MSDFNVPLETARFVAKELPKTLDKAIKAIGTKEDAKAFRAEVLPMVPGAAVVQAGCYAERVARQLKKSGVKNQKGTAKRGLPIAAGLAETQRYFALATDWPAWDEWVNFMRIRECYFHAGGELMSDHARQLRAFLTRKKSKKLKYGMYIVKPYYALDGGEITMTGDWSTRLATTLRSYLNLFQRYGVDVGLPPEK